MEVCGLDSSGSGQRSLGRFCEQGNANPCIVNGEELSAWATVIFWILSSIQRFSYYFEVMWHQTKS